MTNFKTIAEIEAAPTKELIEWFNENSATPVKKFADRQTALRRCINLLEALPKDAEPAPTAVVVRAPKAKEEVAAPAPIAFPVAPVIDQAAPGNAESGQQANVESDEKPKDEAESANKAKRPLSRASNAVGVAMSWTDKDVADARMTRDGVSVTVDGETTNHKSTRSAFRYYRLMDSKHIRFRGILKANKSAVYTEDGLDYLFTIRGE